MEDISSNIRSPDDILSIMVATDIHLGYSENDPVRGRDSFVAFEEVLALAVEYDVDLILLGGDLFDHAKPSPDCMLRCTQLIRQYCLGDKPVAVRLLSDQLQNFARPVNYEDPNLNVSYPILSIHGNHDDPVGREAVSSLDILSSMGLVNYFGKWTDYDEVRVSPVLLQKGDTRLALYGLSHLKDRRLARLFKDDKVVFERPPDGEEWFNLMVLHQNRADRGPDNYVAEACLPPFLDLVVWGHEHDCRVTEEFNGNFYVTQPGSTVATSLSVGESLPKHCALLQVNKKKFILKPVPLQSVRPFIFKTIVLSEEDLGEAPVKEDEKVQELLKNKIYQAVEEAAARRSGRADQPALPLVRLVVHYERDGQDFNRIRFGQNFAGVVANPADLLLMKKEKKHDRRPAGGAETDDRDPARAPPGDALDAADLLSRHFADGGLDLLSARAMADAVRAFTDKRDDDAFRATIAAHVRHAVRRLLAETDPDPSALLPVLRSELDAMDAGEVRALAREAAAAASTPPAAEDPKPTRGRGARGGRGSRPGRGRPARAPSPPPTPEPATRRTPRRTAATRASPAWLQSAVAERRGEPRVSLRRLDDEVYSIEDSD